MFGFGNKPEAPTAESGAEAVGALSEKLAAMDTSQGAAFGKAFGKLSEAAAAHMKETSAHAIALEDGRVAIAIEALDAERASMVAEYLRQTNNPGGLHIHAPEGANTIVISYGDEATEPSVEAVKAYLEAAKAGEGAQETEAA